MTLLVVIFVVFDYAEHVDDFLDRGATNAQVWGTYYPSYVPEMVKLVSPLAVFLAAIFVTARLSGSLQLTALTMAGVSLYRILRPYLLVALVITGGLLAFNGYLVPRTNTTRLAFQQQYLRDGGGRVETSEIFRQAGPHTLLALGYYDDQDERAFRVSLQELGGAPLGGLTLGDTSEAARPLRRRLDASDMQWIDSLEVWRFEDVTETRFSASGTLRQRSIARLDTALAVLPRDLARTERDAERLTIPEARAYVASLRRSGAAGLERPLTDYYAKFAYPVACLVLVLLGVPLASVRRRGGQAAQLALGLGVAVLYLGAQRTSEALGWAGTLPPIVAAWLPHALFGLLALGLLLAVRK